jgi:NTE family protein
MNLERPMQGLEAPPRRVVTLAFLSKRLPSALLGEQVAQVLRDETGASVALVRLARTNNLTDTTIRRTIDLMLGDGLQLPAQLTRTDNGFYFINLGVRDELCPPEWIASLLEQLRRRFRYTLIEAVSEELPAPSLFEFLLRSDSGYLFIQPTNDDVYHLDLLIRELRPQQDNRLVQLKPVLCLGEGEVVDGYDKLIESVASPVDVFIRGCPKSEIANARPTGSFRADVRRLAREIGSCLVGLALSSGAAKGLSHIGVIQVLEENGIDVDVVAGASMGAYVGAAWACGFDGQKLEKLAREMESPWAFWKLIDPAFPPRQGFIRGGAVKKRLMKSIGHVRFAELARPLRVLATNLETLERVVFSSGEVADAVHASIAVPGICVPVIINGETYIDGGIVDPLPEDVLREMGVNRIIAVNAIPTPDRIRYCVQAERELAQLPKKRAREVMRKWLPLDVHLNYFARGNILEILMRSVHGGQIRMAESLGRQADLVLRPQICEDNWMDFRNPGRFIKPGRQIAERFLGEIKALVARKAVENESALEPMAAVA